MRRIVATSLRFRWIVLFLAAATLALGFIQIPETKVDVFPEFAPPQVEIQTIALGNSSNEVEELITVPIENQLNGIEGLEDLRSKSVAQLSSIRLIFSRDTDELRARQLVAERLSQITATLPTWASPPFMMPALSATSRIMKIGLTSETMNLHDMSDLAYWKIRARLLRVSGVAQVAIYGEGLLLIVQKYRGANTLEVSRGVEEAMAELAPGLPGIEYDTTIFRPATFIEQSIENLQKALLWGIGLVVLILIAFLFEWRTAFISLIAILLSLVAAVLVLDAAGATINVMVLAGLVVAVGVVVDDAIIDVENVVRRLRQARAEG